MAAMGGDQRQMMEHAAEDKFPEGLRVLAVDGDCVCLKVLEVLLRRCKYNPTTVMDAKKALKMLRAGKEQFDLVITDVRMPDMDGFKLLELIRLEMDLPVIMLSVDCDKKAVMKGIIHGACDYFVKPVHTNELKNIWQHVETRRRSQAISHMSRDNDDDQRVQTGTVAKSKDSKNKGNNEYDSNENKESTHASSTHKNPRVTWKIELHNKFLEAINQIGLDKATPNKILELMNVYYLTRHNIASHLQKYRLYLNRIKANPLGDATERHSSSMNNRVNFMHDHGHERWHVSSGGNASWSPNYFSATGHLGQLAKTQSNLSMGSLIHGGRMSRYLVPQMPDARIFAGFDDTPISLYDDILNDTMLDEFSSHGSGTSYADSMRGKLMETSNGKIPSNLQSCLANTSSGGGRSAPANEYQVQPLQTINQYHTHMDAPSTQVVSTVRNSSKFPSFVGNYNNPRQSSMQVELTGNLHRGGTSLVPSHVDIPRINQLASYETSSNQLLLQNKISPFINNNTLVASFNEQVAPFNIPSNTRSVGMLNAHNSPPMAPSLMVNGGSNTTLLASFSEKIPSFKIASNTSSVGTIPNGNSSPGTGRILMTETNMVNCGRTISALFNLQTDGLLTLTQILDGGDAAAILPMQEGIVNQQELNDQLNDINGFSSDDIANLLNDDFIGEDIVMDGE